MNFQKLMASQKLIIGMLLLLRAIKGFVPTLPVQSTTSTVTRRLHYNSLWIQRRAAPTTTLVKNSKDSDASTTQTSDDVWAAYRNENNMNDQVVSAISKEGGIKVTSCTIRNMVNDLMIQHTMTEVAIQAIGRTLTCAVLMANGMQHEQTVQITLNCK